MPVPQESPLQSTSIDLLLVAFAAVLLMFAMSAGYAHHSVHAIDAAAQAITENAAPGIEHLAAAREEVRSVELLLDRALDADAPSSPKDGAVLPAVEHERQRLHAHVAAYEQTPDFPGERARWERARRDLAALDDALDQTTAQLAAGDLAAARATLDHRYRPLADHSVFSTQEVIRLNAAEAHDLGQQIQAIRHSAARRTALLDLASFWLCVVTVLLALRTVWRFETALAHHRALAERRADELEQFAGRIAHDIAGPLTVAELALQSAERRAAPEDASGGLLGRGRASVRRVLRLVDGLLGFAKAGARPERDARCDVRTVVEDTVDGLQPSAHEARVALVVEPFTDCAVVASAGVLTSLLGNLLANAIKYMGDATERRVGVRVLPRDALVRVEVHDTGPGLPSEIATTLFEPWVRGAEPRAPGLGLGLATVKRLAVSHGGTVGHAPRAEGGTVFWFELPAPREEGATRAPGAWVPAVAPVRS